MNDKIVYTEAEENKLSDKFTPLIIRNCNGFCVHLQELNISGEGKTLEDAYQQYENNKKQLEARVSRFGLEAVTVEPFPTIKRGVLLRDLTYFFTKTVLGSFAVILVIIILLPNISNAVSHQITTVLNAVIRPEFQNAKFWATELPEKLNIQLDRLDSKEEAKMAAEWNKFYNRVNPILGPLLCAVPNKSILEEQ